MELVKTLLEMKNRRERLKGLRIEDILNEELRREMGVEPDPATGKLKLHQRLNQITDWEDIMNSVYDLPIELDGYDKKVSELHVLKEMVDILSIQEFDNVKRSESRKKQLELFTNSMNMYYNLVFTKGAEKTGYGVLIYFPELRKDDPERSHGIVLVEKKVISSKKSESKFERARFDDFLIEVRPYIEMLGDLYRKDKRKLRR